MRLPHPQPDRRRFDVKMTPMIDVVFLLLIFFVCTASFRPEEAILPVPLPFARAESAAGTPWRESEIAPLVIELHCRGRRIEWRVEGRSLGTLAAVDRLLRAMAAVAPERAILLEVDQDASMSDAIDLYDVCRLAGFATIQFAASGGP